MIEDQIGIVDKFGFFWAVIAQLPWFCFVFDYFLSSLHLPMISLLVGLTAALLSGGLVRNLTTMPGIGYAFVTLWMFLGLPFAYWRGGAFTVLTDVWVVTASTFFVVASLVNTKERVRISVIALAAGAGLTVWGATFLGKLYYGRLGIPASRFGDANDLALVCVMSLPLLGFVALNRTWFPVRLFAIISLPFLFYTFLRTGSRGGMVGMAAVFVVMFLKTSMGNKAKLIAVGIVVLAMAPFIASEDVLQRFMLLSTSATGEQGTMSEGATDSSRARMHLLRRSIEVTFMYPIFGVGLGNFVVVDHDISTKEEGRIRGAWHVTHNMYTQWSSEAGIPALAMLLAILIYCWRALSKVERAGFSSVPESERQFIKNMAFAFKASLIGYCCCGFFLGVAYVGQLPVLIALLSQFAKTHLQMADSPAPAVRPAIVRLPERRLVPGR